MSANKEWLNLPIEFEKAIETVLSPGAAKVVLSKIRQAPNQYETELKNAIKTNSPRITVELEGPFGQGLSVLLTHFAHSPNLIKFVLGEIFLAIKQQEITSQAHAATIENMLKQMNHSPPPRKRSRTSELSPKKVKSEAKGKYATGTNAGTRFGSGSMSGSVMGSPVAGTSAGSGSGNIAVAGTSAGSGSENIAVAGSSGNNVDSSKSDVADLLDIYDFSPTFPLFTKSEGEESPEVALEKIVPSKFKDDK